MSVFVQGPHTFLNELGIALPALDNEDEIAILASDHHSRVNWESYFFSCRDEKARFDVRPLAFCGLLTDPVTRDRFQPGPSSPRYVYEGTPFFFSSDSTLAVFASMADSLSVPMHRMRPRLDR